MILDHLHLHQGWYVGCGSAKWVCAIVRRDCLQILGANFGRQFWTPMSVACRCAGACWWSWLRTSSICLLNPAFHTLKQFSAMLRNGLYAGRNFPSWFSRRSACPKRWWQGALSKMNVASPSPTAALAACSHALKRAWTMKKTRLLDAARIKVSWDLAILQRCPLRAVHKLPDHAFSTPTDWSPTHQRIRVRDDLHRSPRSAATLHNPARPDARPRDSDLAARSPSFWVRSTGSSASWSPSIL